MERDAIFMKKVLRNSSDTIKTMFRILKLSSAKY